MPKFHFDKLSNGAKQIIVQATQEQIGNILEAGDHNGLRIELFVNGIDLSANFNKLGEAIDRQFDLAVEKAALELMQARYSELIYRLQQASNALELGDLNEPV